MGVEFPSGALTLGISSVSKRIMVAIRCSIRLEVPLGEMGRMMVSPEYVRYLVGIANEKMAANRNRTDAFLGLFTASKVGLLLCSLLILLVC